MRYCDEGIKEIRRSGTEIRRDLKVRKRENGKQDKEIRKTVIQTVLYFSISFHLLDQDVGSASN